MNKIFNCTLLFYSLFLGSILQAQEKPVRFGIRAGVNFSSMNYSEGSPPPEISVRSSWKAGGAAGFLMIVPLSGNFYIQPEYLYSQMGGKLSSTQTTYEFNYLSLPVFLRWEATQRLSFLAGPEFSLLINAKEKNGDSIEVVTKGLEDRSLAAAFGTEFNINPSFLIGVKYMIGINHIDYIEIQQDKGFKYEMLQGSIVYIF
jgi:hypothetical protein